MKIAASILLALSVVCAYAQSPHQSRVAGEGEFADAQSPDRNALMQAQADDIATLMRTGTLVRPKAQAAVNDLQWPLQPAEVASESWWKLSEACLQQFDHPEI